jgi:hypothetical protein
MDVLNNARATRCHEPRIGTTLLTAAPGIVAGQTLDVAPDTAVKAAFLYNFAKFTEWPVLPSSVTKRSPPRSSRQSVDRKISGHTLNVLRPQDSATWRTSHVLFLTGAGARRSAEALGAIKKLAVLTVSDGEGFARAGGVIELYVEGGRMRFSIVDAAEQSGLRRSRAIGRLSPRLGTNPTLSPSNRLLLA